MEQFIINPLIGQICDADHQYIISPKGKILNVSSGKTFIDGLPSAAKIYAPYPLNIIVLTHIIKSKNQLRCITNKNLSLLQIYTSLAWVLFERYIRGSDTHSKYFFNKIATNISNMNKDIYPIHIKAWIESLIYLKKHFHLINKLTIIAKIN